jgi:hypothetical protein
VYAKAAVCFFALSLNNSFIAADVYAKTDVCFKKLLYPGTAGYWILVPRYMPMAVVFLLQKIAIS